MSRFLDFRPGNLGFLTKEVLVAGGGVTAGSADSSPSDFLVKVEVAMPKRVEG